MEEFSAYPLGIDVAGFHTYGVDWRPGSLAFTVDGLVVRRLDQAPDYPMQLMIGVFDFPARADADDVEIPFTELVAPTFSDVRSSNLGELLKDPVLASSWCGPTV